MEKTRKTISAKRGLLSLALLAVALKVLYSAYLVLCPPIAILNLHGVGKPKGASDFWTLRPAFLEKILDLTRELAFKTTTARDLPDWLNKRWLRPKLLVLSFDDGDRNLLDKALPLLKRKGMTASFFINTDGRKGTWTAKETARVVADGFDVQSHGHCHESLTRKNGEKAGAQRARIREILRRGKSEVERWTGKPVSCLAYPCGEVDAAALAEAKAAGFTLLFTTEYGYLDARTDRRRIPRFILSRFSRIEDVREFLTLPYFWNRVGLAAESLVLLFLLWRFVATTRKDR